MTFETAQAVSLALAKLRVSHTVQVGHHDKYAPEGPSEVPEIHCRVDLGIPRCYDGGLGQAIRDLEGIAEQHGLVLSTSFMGEGLTFSTPVQTAGSLLRRAHDETRWPGQK